MSIPAIEAKNLTVTYSVRDGTVRAVRDVSFKVEKGEAFGLLGESGCGKTTLAMALLSLLPENAVIEQGQIILDGQNLVGLEPKQLKSVRWAGVSMIFQAAMSAFSPVHKVGEQIGEALELHQGLSYNDAQIKVGKLYEWVGIQPDMAKCYPHEYSGGMKQRAMIAMALSCNPVLVLADEPTTALDVLVQKQILRKLQSLQTESQTAFIYISHDISVVAAMSTNVGVMYAGKLVETGSVKAVFETPRHPYTKALMNSLITIHGERRELVSIDGEPPDLTNLPKGCSFQPRCQYAQNRCLEADPIDSGTGGRQNLCWFPIKQDGSSEDAKC